MPYKKLSTVENRFKYMIDKTQWKRNFVGIITDDMEKKVNYLLMSIDELDEMIIKFFAIQCSFAKFDEWESNFAKWIAWRQSGIAFKNNLEHYIMRYGIEYGTNKFNNYIEKARTINVQRMNKANKSRVEYWLSRGYSIDYAINTSASIQSNIAKTSCKRLHAYYKQHGRPASKNTLAYWLNRGYSNEEAERNRQLIVQKSIISKQKYKEKYGDNWEYYWKITQNKKKISRDKFFSGQGEVVSRKASKESLKIFLPLREYLIENDIILDENIFIGYNEKSEWRIINRFYDFTIIDKKLIIEYNNIRYHPVSEYEYENLNFFDQLGLSVKEKYQYDRDKIALAEKYGYKVLEIWNTTPIDDNINICKNWILTHAR